MNRLGSVWFMCGSGLCCGHILPATREGTGKVSPQLSNTKALQFGMLNMNKLHGPSLRANYTDRATAACRRSG
jgi:hypothetical protein